MCKWQIGNRTERLFKCRFYLFLYISCWTGNVWTGGLQLRRKAVPLLARQTVWYLVRGFSVNKVVSVLSWYCYLYQYTVLQINPCCCCCRKHKMHNLRSTGEYFPGKISSALWLSCIILCYSSCRLIRQMSVIIHMKILWIIIPINCPDVQTNKQQTTA